MILSLFGSSRKSGSIGDKFRAQRFKHFESLINQLNKPIRILDIGGTEYYWENRGYSNKEGVEVTLLNLTLEEIRCKNMKAIVGNATDLSEYPENSFDIVFSNSVIEHLYTLEKQKKMASECMRVGKFFYIQTPNKYFPIEPHFRMPFFNFWPRCLKKFILIKTPLSLGKKWSQEKAEETISEIRLLNQKEFESLFANGRTYTEWLLIFKKSFTVHNFK